MARFVPTWVLVADRARGRIFSWTDFQGPLTEIQDLVNPEGRLKNSELASERPGVTFSSKGHTSSHRMQSSSMVDSATDSFARSLADELKAGLDGKQCERLVVAAPPEFLGQLRAHFDPRTEKAVAASLDSNMTRESAETILSRLPRLNNLAPR